MQKLLLDDRNIKLEDIEDRTGARLMASEEGEVQIYARDEACFAAAQEAVKDMEGSNLVEERTYSAKVGESGRGSCAGSTNYGSYFWFLNSPQKLAQKHLPDFEQKILRANCTTRAYDILYI